MMRRRLLLLGLPAVLSLAAIAGFAGQAPPPRPAIAGGWEGTWSVHLPAAAGEGAPRRPQEDPYFRMTCQVRELRRGRWEATFEGDSGRPYKYTLRVPGRQVGRAVLFQGSVDLGPEDGGTHDWIGRATETEFVGFFTSAGYTGSFRLARPSP
jgi:hypothetical protein